MTNEDHLDGTVIQSQGKWYEVHTGRGVVRSRVRGKFRLRDRRQTNPIAVGDRVTVRLNEDDDTGLITEIHPRRNQLSRRSASPRREEEHVLVANVDRAWEVQAVDEPPIDPGHIDRFLIMAQLHEIPAGIIVNKIDLLDTSGPDSSTDREETDPSDEPETRADDVRKWSEIYRELDYPVIHTSAETGRGMKRLAAELRDRTSVFTGPSGVGKSTLLNRLEPDLDLRTGRVSPSSRRGRHTTTHAGLYPLSTGGYVVDTPGVEGFGLVHVDPDELDWFFVETRPFVPDCHFPSCTHDHEPRCAVQDAVDEGAIRAPRYESYLAILHELQEKQPGPA